jgi:hypothetical protein
MTAAEIAGRLPGVRRSGRGWLACCPVHEADGKRHTPSFGIVERNGRVLVRCYAGCAQDAVIDALRACGLWPEREQPQWTLEERARWAAERHELKRQLPPARLWRGAAVSLAEETLDMLKAALFDPTMEFPEAGEIYRIEHLLSRLRSLEGGALVDEYSWWAARYPLTTAALVREGRERERTDVRAVCLYFGIPDSLAAGCLRKLGGVA